MRSLNTKNSNDLYFEEYKLEHTSALDYGGVLQKNLPCKKCKIMTAGQTPVLTLVAPSVKELELLKKWVQLIDQPKESITVTLYCVIVQEHKVDNFLSTLLYQTHSSILAWKEGLTNLLLDMEREHGVTLLASPRLTIEVGSKATLKMSDDFKIGGQNHGESQQIDLALALECHRQGQDGYRLDVDLVQKVLMRSYQNASSPHQHNQLKTRSTLRRGDLVFLGSAGQWSWISDQGSYSFFKILPAALVPFFHHDKGSKSQLIILAECH